MTIGAFLLEVVDTDAGFPWGIHIITIPLVLIAGVLLGWTIRDRKAADEEARRQINERSSAERPPSA